MEVAYGRAFEAHGLDAEVYVPYLAPLLEMLNACETDAEFISVLAEHVGPVLDDDMDAVKALARSIEEEIARLGSKGASPPAIDAGSVNDAEESTEEDFKEEEGEEHEQAEGGIQPQSLNAAAPEFVPQAGWSASSVHTWNVSEPYDHDSVDDEDASFRSDGACSDAYDHGHMASAAYDEDDDENGRLATSSPGRRRQQFHLFSVPDNEDQGFDCYADTLSEFYEPRLHAKWEVLDQVAGMLEVQEPEQLEQLWQLHDDKLARTLSTLIGKDGALDASHDSQSDDDDDADDMTPDKARRIPCKFYMHSRCFRNNCWYSHDLSSIPCKFYAEGYCRNDSSCRFQHGTPCDILREHSAMLRQLVDDLLEAAKQRRQEQLSEAAFPSLDGKDHASSTWREPGRLRSSRSQTSQDSDSLTAAERLKLSELGDRFPHVWPEDIKRLFMESTKDTEKAAEAIRQAFPGTHEVQPQTHRQAAMPQLPSAAMPKGRDVDQEPIAVIDWVETGEAVNQEYTRLRKKAIDLAKTRNRLLQEATRAYLNNDRRLAKELSWQGRDIEQDVFEAHRTAARVIFARRNANTSKNVIDLHGLHVKEALAYLHAFLEDQEKRNHTKCYIITGTGHHSKHKHLAQSRQARLLPNVRATLRNMGLHFTDASTDMRGGMLEVRLNPSSW